MTRRALFASIAALFGARKAAQTVKPPVYTLAETGEVLRTGAQITWITEPQALWPPPRRVHSPGTNRLEQTYGADGEPDGWVLLPSGYRYNLDLSEERS